MHSHLHALNLLFKSKPAKCHKLICDNLFIFTYNTHLCLCRNNTIFVKFYYLILFLAFQIFSSCNQIYIYMICKRKFRKLNLIMTNFLSPVFTFFVNYFGVFLKAKPYSLYVLVVLYLTYMLNQLDRYALSITSVETAQELKYGNRACFKNSTASKSDSDVCTWKNVTENQTL